MKRFLVLIALLFASPSWAYTNGYIAAAIQGGAGGGGCTYETACAAGCTLFSWDMTSTTVTGATCSLGDAAATLVGAGVSGGALNLTDGTDYAVFDIAAYDLFPSGEVTVRMDVNLTTITTGGYLLYAYFDSSNYVKVYFSGTAIRIMHAGAGGGVYSTMTGSDLATSTATKLIVKIGYSGIELKKSVDAGENWTTYTYTSSAFTPMNHSGTAALGLRIGNPTANVIAGTIDNVIISAGWRDDL